MTTVACQITSLTVVYSIFIHAQIKESIKAPPHWPLCGEFTGTGEFPAQRVSNAENVSIWWRHHEMKRTNDEQMNKQPWHKNYTWFRNSKELQTGFQSVISFQMNWTYRMYLVNQLDRKYFSQLTDSCTVRKLLVQNDKHYNDVIMSAMASQITKLTIVYSTVYTGADQRKHQSSVSLAFVRGIHRWQVNSPHKGPVTRKMFPFDDVNILQAAVVPY